MACVPPAPHALFAAATRKRAPRTLPLDVRSWDVVRNQRIEQQLCVPRGFVALRLEKLCCPCSTRLAKQRRVMIREITSADGRERGLVERALTLFLRALRRLRSQPPGTQATPRTDATGLGDTTRPGRQDSFYKEVPRDVCQLGSRSVRHEARVRIADGRRTGGRRACGARARPIWEGTEGRGRTQGDGERDCEGG